MPSLPAADRVAKMEILQEIAGVNVVNILHFRKASAIAAGDIATLATTAKNAWQTNMLPNQVNNLTLQAIQCTDLTSNTGEQVYSPSGQLGTNTDPELPSSAAMVITIKSATRSRSGRGRIYLAGLTTPMMATLNSWTGAAMNDVATDFAAFVTACQNAGGASTWSLGVLSYYSGVDPTTKKPILRGVPVFFPFTSLAVDSRIDTQRRRLGRRPSAWPRSGQASQGCCWRGRRTPRWPQARRRSHPTSCSTPRAAAGAERRSPSTAPARTWRTFR